MPNDHRGGAQIHRFELLKTGKLRFALDGLLRSDARTQLDRLNQFRGLADDHGTPRWRSFVNKIFDIVAGIGVGGQSHRTPALGGCIGLKGDSIVGQLGSASLKLDLHNRAILSDGDLHRDRFACGGIRGARLGIGRSRKLFVDTEAQRELGSVVGIQAMHIGDPQAAVDGAGLRQIEDRKADLLSD